MASLISRNKLALALAISCTLALARAADTNDVHLTILQRMSDARVGKDKCAAGMWKDNKCTLDSWKVRPTTEETAQPPPRRLGPGARARAHAQRRPAAPHPPYLGLWPGSPINRRA